MALYLKDSVYVDWKTLRFTQGHIKINEGADGTIEFAAEIPAAATVLDCKNRLVTKAFGCAHHHVYSALARGMPAPKKTPQNFHQVLKYIWWALDKKLDLETIEACALVTALYCAKKGVTFVFDHHSSPNAVRDSLSTIARAFDRVGISYLPCYELSDRGGEIPRRQGLEETENFLLTGRPGLVGLHASFTVGEDLLKQAVDLVEKYDSGIHVHAAEDPIDQEHCLENYKKRVIERFRDAGVLNKEKTILAHCLHLSSREWEILKASPAFVVQNVESNLNNNVGFFTPPGYVENLMLGTDGMHSDMLRSAKVAYFVGRHSEQVSVPEIYRRFRKIHDYTAANGFPGDGENNLIILDYDTPTEVNRDNFLSHFIYGIEANHIESVISRGKLIVKNKKILTIDENEALTFSKQMAGRLWSALVP
ncbi:MAG: amidohydrolase family protein [Candidatus Aminicenantes bacterium]|nr:amidohydrolase family protein [Candidatus Aminicenantes bacterium]